MAYGGNLFERRRRAATYMRGYRVNHPPDPEIQKSNWKKYWADPKFRRKYKDKRREHLYGISAEEFSVLAKQGCAICGRKTEPSGDDLSVDHCHKSGKWRGVLCRRCNTMIGMLESGPKILERALIYLGRKIKVNFSKIKTATFRGKKFRVQWKRPRKSAHESAAHGACDCPNESDKVLFIHPNTNHEELLDTIIHEGLHAAFWDLEEPAVVQCCEDIRHLLRRMGMRVKFFGPK